MRSNRVTKFSQRLWDVFPFVLLMISALIIFSKVIFPGKPLYGSDFVLYFHPVKDFIRDHVLVHGALPFWNPYQFSGTPFISNIQASMFYPLGFLFYILPTEYAYGYTIILHCILGGIFMYVFARSIRLEKAGAFLAAIIFMYNGFFMGHLYAGHLTFVQNYIWIPLVFFFVYRFLETTHFKWALSGGLSLGIQILGGFPQIAFYTILAILAFGIFYMGITLKTQDIRKVVRMGFGVTTVICIGFALAAIQLLPTLEFTQLSGRAGGISYWFATFDSLNPKMLLSFFIPGLFGSPADGTYWLGPNDWCFWETCGYVGILPLCLIFVSVPKTEPIWNVRYFFAGLIILSLFLAFGKYNPLYPIIFKLPGFSSFRIPAQILFLYVFGVAVLSGLALHHIEEGPSRFAKGLKVYLMLGGLAFFFLLTTMHFFPYQFFPYLFKLFSEAPIHPALIQRIPQKVAFSVNWSALLFSASFVLLLSFHKNKLSRTLFKTTVLCVVIIDLGLYSIQFVKPHEFAPSTEKQNLIQQLKSKSERGRILTSESAFLPNDGLLYRFQSVDGYDPLILKRYILYLQASQQLPPEKHVLTTSFVHDFNHKFLKMLNLRHVLLDNSIATADTFVPRAVIVNKAVVRPAEQILDFMNSNSFDPFKMVVFEPESRPLMLQKNNRGAFEGSCSITYYDNEKIRIRASTNQAGYLVLSEMFYPGWEATVDGEKVPILRGNYLFRAVPLEEGNHEVEMRFVSWPFRVGMMISLLTVIGSLSFIMWKRK